VGPIAQPG